MDRGPDDFRGLIPYQAGHQVGRIAWKALSRGQGLFIKDFAAQAGGFELLDFHAFPSGTTEYRLSRLCGMVLDSDRRQIRFGLQLPGRIIPPSWGSAHTKACLRALALFDPKGDFP